MQPVAVIFESSFGWLNVRHLPTPTIRGNHGEPIVIRFTNGSSLNGRLHHAHERIQKESWEGYAWEVRVRDLGGEKRFLLSRQERLERGRPGTRRVNFESCEVLRDI